MTIYEHRCRVLLRAFPEQYRSERGDEIVGVMVDMAPPSQRWPTLRTAADLVAAGLRIRSKLTSQGRASVAVVEGMRLAALVGLCLQAAFAVAMVAHRAHDGMLFYATNNGWSTGALDAMAAGWVLAFVLVVAGRTRLAILPSVLASAWGVLLLVSNFGGRGNFNGVAPAKLLLRLEIATTVAVAVSSGISLRRLQPH